MSTTIQVVLAVLASAVFIGLLAHFGARLAERRRYDGVPLDHAARQIRAIQHRTLRQMIRTAHLADLHQPPQRRGSTSVAIIDIDDVDETVDRS